MTGWQWTAIPNSGASTTSHTIDGHTYGKEYRYKIRAVNDIGGNSKPAPDKSETDGQKWYLSVTIPNPTPPLTDLWTVRVCDDLFKVRWNFVPGATGYDMDMSGNNRQSWQRKMTNKNVNAWQFSQWTKNATFWFRVRAVNSHGASDWRYVKSIAPPCRVEGLRAGYTANGTMYVEWKPAKRAIGYDVNFSADNGRSWQRMESNTAATSASFTKDPAALPYNPNFLVAVQSRKGNITGGWRNAPIAGLTASSVAGTTATLNLWNHSGNWYYLANDPPHDTGCYGPVSGAVKDLTGLHAGTDYQYTAYSDSSCAYTISSVTFATPVTLSVTNVTATGATLNLDGHDLQWWYDADTGPHMTCQGPVAAGTSTADLTGLGEHSQYTYKAYNASGCNAGDLLASLTFEPSGDVLSVESVTAITATLKLTNHTGDWWFKQTAPTAGTCTAGEADFTNALSDLIPGTQYTYKSYDVNTCGDTHVGASVTFTTLGVSVSNLGETDIQTCRIGGHEGFADRSECGAVFETGSATNGYTLHSVTLKFISKGGTPGAFKIALYEASGDYPAANPVQNATLSGSDPLASGNYTYTCAGIGCDLRKETKYVFVMSSPESLTSANNHYRWRLTSSSNETPYPSSNGWSIADKAVGRQGGSWYEESYAGMFKVAATVK